MAARPPAPGSAAAGAPEVPRLTMEHIGRIIPRVLRALAWWIEYHHGGKRYSESAGRTGRVALRALAIRRAEIAQGKSRTDTTRRSRRLDGSAPE